MSFVPKTQNFLSNLLTLLNQSNGTSFTTDDFNVGYPVALTSNSAHNTSILLSPVQASLFYGDVTIEYTRFNLKETKFSQGELDATTIYQELSKIRALTQLIITEDDVEDGAITLLDPSNPLSSRVFKLKAKPTSLYCIGEIDVSFNPQYEVPPIVDGKTRVLFYHTKETLENAKNSLRAFWPDTIQEDTNFKFLNNVTNIKTFSIDTIHRFSNGEFVVHGTFTFDVTLNGNLLPSLTPLAFITDVNGSIKEMSNGYYYNFLPNLLDKTAKLIEHHKVDFKILSNVNYIPSQGPNQSGLYKIKDGKYVSDPTFIPMIDYAPEVVRLAANGNIYTVSPIYSGIDSTSGTNQARTLRRIDRMLPTGEKDSSFKTVYLYNPTREIEPVLDLIETANGLVYVSLNPVYGCDKNVSNPQVNSVPLAKNISAATTYSWNNVFRLKANGDLDVTFNTTLGYLSSSRVAMDYSLIAEKDSPTLQVRGDDVISTVYRPAPLTGFSYPQQQAYDYYGKQLSSEFHYGKLNTIRNLHSYDNMMQIVSCQLQTLADSEADTYYESPVWGLLSTTYVSGNFGVKILKSGLNEIVNSWISEA